MRDEKVIDGSQLRLAEASQEVSPQTLATSLAHIAPHGPASPPQDQSPPHTAGSSRERRRTDTSIQPTAALTLKMEPRQKQRQRKDTNKISC